MMIAPPTDKEPPFKPQRTCRSTWIEVSVVLLAAYAPSAVGQIIRDKGLSGPLLPYYELFGALSIIALILFIVWIRDASLEKIGGQKFRPVDFLIGLGLCLVFFAVGAYLRAAIPPDLYKHWYAMGKPSPVQEEVFGKVPIWSIFPGLFAVNALEEVLMRGYLTGRLLELLSTKWAAVLLSSILFALWHIYEGPIGVLNALAIGLIFGTFFVYARRLWPLIVAHFSYDTILTLLYIAYLRRHHL